MDRCSPAATLNPGSPREANGQLLAGQHPGPGTKDTHMTLQAMSRWVGPISIVAAAMVILSQGLQLGLGLAMGPQSADSVLQTR